MHTEPIPGLIESLKTSSVKELDGTILISGTNKNGDFRMEFPVFVLAGSIGKKTTQIKKHLEEVKGIAIDYLAYISSIEQTK
jgi:hypothetical protein